MSKRFSMDIKKAISQLSLPDGSFMVVGSGLLDTLGIRAAGDIDLLVSHDVFNNLKHQNYKIQQHEDGSDYISIGRFEIMVDWFGNDLETMRESAVYIDEIPYWSLESMREWKCDHAREKDVRDIALIDEYRQQCADIKTTAKS